MSEDRTPFLLEPIGKDYLWGGSRLNDDFNLGLKVNPLAEAWVCSTHPYGVSTVPAYSCSLGHIITGHPSWLGNHARSVGKENLPIIIKLIDAKQNLSLQVHPDDKYAKRVENSLGKTEMWYVIDVKPGAQLIYGFNRDVMPGEVRDAIVSGTFEELLNHVDVHKGDLFFIEPGTVHAIGAGCLIAEIQESSNITYRLYDYDRIGKDGFKRPLHIERALDVMKMESSASPRQPLRVLKYRLGYASELLARCKYFQVERLLLNTEDRKLPEFKTAENSFHSFLCTSGCGVLFGDGVMINFFKGDCIFIPAESIPFKLHGRAEILDVSC